MLIDVDQSHHVFSALLHQFLQAQVFSFYSEIENFDGLNVAQSSMFGKTQKSYENSA